MSIPSKVFPAFLYESPIFNFYCHWLFKSYSFFH